MFDPKPTLYDVVVVDIVEHPGRHRGGTHEIRWRSADGTTGVDYVTNPHPDDAPEVQKLKASIAAHMRVVGVAKDAKATICVALSIPGTTSHRVTRTWWLLPDQIEGAVERLDRKVQWNRTLITNLHIVSETRALAATGVAITLCARLERMFEQTNVLDELVKAHLMVRHPHLGVAFTEWGLYALESSE